MAHANSGSFIWCETVVHHPIEMVLASICLATLGCTCINMVSRLFNLSLDALTNEIALLKIWSPIITHLLECL